MNELIEYIILASRRRSPKGWGNIVFIVGLAIFWLISAIFKSMARKDEEKKTGEKQLSRKPGGKPAVGTTKEGPFQQIRRAIEAEVQKQRQLQAQQTQRKVVRPQPAARKVVAKPAMQRVATKPGRGPEIHALESIEETKLPSAIAEVEPKLEKLPEYTSKTVKAVGANGISAAAQVPQGRQLLEILMDYSDPDELKRAILHYEILGKPLSLRDPTGQIIGL